MNTKKILLLSVFAFSSLLAQDSLYLYTVFHGENDQDQFGIVENVGDVNGDGFEDLLVGAPGAPRNLFGGTRHSYVKLYYGGSKFDTIPDFIFNKYDNNVVFGSTVTGSGDLNGDGISDFAIADPNWGEYSVGKVYVYFGGAELDTIPDLEITLDQNLNFYTNFGFSMAMNGDINHDGYDDLAIGAPRDDYYRQGKVFIYFGGPNMDNQADINIISNIKYQRFGFSLDYIGDVNNDYFDDLLVGTLPLESDVNAYIFWGDKNNNIGFQNSYEFIGNDGLARDVSRLGDINNDGFNDFALLSSDSITICLSPFANGFSKYIFKRTVETGSFYRINYSPDINGDGFDEIIISTEVTQTLPGKVIILYGDKSISMQNMKILESEDLKPGFGYQVASFTSLFPNNVVSIALGYIEAYMYYDEGSGKVFIYNNDVINSIGDYNNPMVIKDFKLYQNYPNPFNPSTTINYQIPYLSTVQLRLYDQLGREIKTLVSTTKPPGIYSTHLNTEDLHLASGVYFLRMHALAANNNSKAFQKIIKLILTK